MASPYLLHHPLLTLFTFLSIHQTWKELFISSMNNNRLQSFDSLSTETSFTSTQIQIKLQSNIHIYDDRQRQALGESKVLRLEENDGKNIFRDSKPWKDFKLDHKSEPQSSQTFLWPLRFSGIKKVRSWMERDLKIVWPVSISSFQNFIIELALGIELHYTQCYILI